MSKFLERSEGVDEASPVDLHRLPNWFCHRLRKAFGPTTFGNTHGEWLFWYWARRHCNSTIWLDHWGTAVVDGHPVAVSEPYLLINDDVSDAERFAEAIGCQLVIDPNSYHYPGKTIRLTFSPTLAV